MTPDGHDISGGGQDTDFLDKVLFDRAPIPAVLVADGRVQTANRAAEKRFGPELVGRSFDAVVAELGADIDVQVVPIAGLSNGSGGDRELELAQFVDLTEHHARERELAYRAEHDTLTGLLNRAGLEAALDRLLTDPPIDPERPGAVLFCDMNGFKPVNDGHGHLVGDQVVVVVAQRIADTLRRTDGIGRFGGDEFIVLLPDIGWAEAEATARRVLNAVAEPVEVGVTTARVGIDIGGVMLDRDATADEVLAAADAAMYRAKAMPGSYCYEIVRP